MNKLKTLSLIDGNKIDLKQISKLKTSKNFTFDILSHKLLSEMKIDHSKADNLLNVDERKKIFDHVVSQLYWYENKSFKNDFFIDGYNILEMLDPLYLLQKLLVILVQFSIIKKILESEKPSKIFVTQNLSKIVSSIDNDVELVLLNSEKIAIFDTFDLRISLFSKIFTINISMKKLKQLQNIFESFIVKLFNLQLNLKEKKPTILLLEFDPAQFENLFLNLKNSKSNLVILNRRKSALHNLKSISIVKNSKAKLINFENLLSKEEKTRITNLQNKYKKILNTFWKKEKTLSEIFFFNNSSYWSCVQDFFIKQYEKEISNNIENLIQSKSIFQNLNINCVLYQYESGIHENTTLSQRQNATSLLLRHGFSSYTKKFDELRWRHDQFRLLKLKCDEILLWGNSDYEFYSKFLPTSKKLKNIGSPRHEHYFDQKNFSSEKVKTVLITTPPIIDWTGLRDTDLELRYENILKQQIENLKKLNDIKIIAKLHPGWGLSFNSVLIKIFHEIDSKIPVYTRKAVKDIISNSDLIININAEDNQPSTVILEGLIMKKPIINISLNEQNNDLEYDEHLPFISLSYKSDISYYIKQILYDTDFRKKLNLQISSSLEQYLSNHTTASKELSKYLQSFL